MESAEQGKAAMIAGISEDARSEEERLLAEARTLAAEKRKYGQKKAEAILKDAREKAEEEAEVARRKVAAGIELEIKRRSLQVRYTMIKSIMAEVAKRLLAMVGTPDYRAVLIDWITEACLGLQTETAQVNASEAERAYIDASLLAEVQKNVTALSGGKMTLTVSEAKPLDAQGVVVTTADGRVAFNNQVPTRMARRQREIQMLIYNAVFSDGREESL